MLNASIQFADTRVRRAPVRPASANADVQLLMKAVASDFGLDPADFQRPTRGPAHQALARQVAMYLCHVVCGLPFATIGRIFGRDRTTVSYACRVIEDLRDDIGFDRRLATLEQACFAISPVCEGAAS